MKRVLEAPSISAQQPLALAISQIHRSRSLAELQENFLGLVPRFVNADAFGVYLFDDKLQTRTIKSHRVDHRFLSEYEGMRNEDPLFRFLLQTKKFTHSLEIFNEVEWLREPLHDFLSRWGLDYSIEAPLIYDGQVSGTINFAIGGDKYFARDSLAAARFLCKEFDAAYKRILDFEKLQRQVPCAAATETVLQCLSLRAHQVLESLLKGLGNQAIAERLGISENTVRYHIKRLYSSLGVHNRAELAGRVYAEATKQRP